MATTKKFIRFSSNKIYYCHSTTNYNSSISPRYRTVTQIHTECEVFLLLKGAVTYVVEDNSYDVKPGEIVLIPPHTVHYTIVDTSKEYERVALEFPPHILPTFGNLDLLSVFHKAKLHLYTVPKEQVEEYGLMKYILDCKKNCLSKDKYRDVEFAQRIITLVRKLHMISEELIKNARDLLPREKLKVSQICVEFINRNIEKNITVQMISNASFISPSHILHQFKKEMGITLHQYIIMQKIQTADTLLKQGMSPVAVAEKLGYDYYSTFYNNYVKYRRCTPSDGTAPSTLNQRDVVENT